VNRRCLSIGSVLLVAILLIALMGTVATGSTLFGSRFKLGETIEFKIQDSTTWWWGCGSCCAESIVLGWRIEDGSGMTIYATALDPVMGASMWIGTWNQVDANGLGVPAGQYKLLVDTSVGTLSRCFSLYDPCNTCWGGCTTACSPCCEDLSSISECYCKTSLVFVDTCQTGCFPLFWWGGCCSGCCP